GDVAAGQAAVPHRREEPASYPADRDRQKTRPLARPRRLPDSRLQSGYALLSSRIRRHFLILIDARFSSYSPRNSAALILPRGYHWRLDALDAKGFPLELLTAFNPRI